VTLSAISSEPRPAECQSMPRESFSSVAVLFSYFSMKGTFFPVHRCSIECSNCVTRSRHSRKNCSSCSIEVREARRWMYHRVPLPHDHSRPCISGFKIRSRAPIAHRVIQGLHVEPIKTRPVMSPDGTLVCVTISSAYICAWSRHFVMAVWSWRVVWFV